ncbi:uncharacterized protein LOC143894093 isoform X1 [Temnothorax americanus]|uniref:uncharacterized protein LOC143894093 isoform X1 n=1 Tax=Temnothorax americanus TaxID=1964332 RepID=UPI0040675FE7
MRIAYRKKNLSENAINILISSLTDSTLRQYNSGLKNWWNFCKKFRLDPFQAGIEAVLQYLSQRFDNGASYGTLNTERSAISLISLDDSSNNPIMTRFFKGVFKLRPTKAKYDSIWDIEVVLRWAEELEPLETLDLKQLTYKLVILMALATAHRVQTLALIKINNISISQEGVQITITEAIKTSKVGVDQPKFFLPFFKERSKACVARAIIRYLAATKDLRKSEKNLFITINKPHQAANSQSVSRWIKECLRQAGIDTRFTAHSTRHAATSAADRKGIDINIIRKTASWSGQSEVFARFYKRPISSDRGVFASTVLGDR